MSSFTDTLKGWCILNLYEIKLADGDSITYETEMSMDELKKYISTHDFIELPRGKTVPYGNGGWRCVPENASYLTTAIVYINHDTDLEDMKVERQKIIEKNIGIVKDIEGYIFNKRMKFWLWRVAVYWVDGREDNCFYERTFLEDILVRCKKYKCTLKS